MPKFERPANLKFPQIYSTFKAKDKGSDNEVEYLIQDLPVEDYERALDLLVESHLVDETIHACRNIVANPEAVKEAREFWRKKLSEKVSLACFKEGSDDLVGVNVLSVVSKGDAASRTPKTAEFKDIIAAFDFVEAQYKVFDKNNVTAYLSDSGMVVNREYRQRGVASEFLKARIRVAELLGLKVLSSTFTAVGSQKAAEKAGYTEVYSISFSELANHVSNFDFSIAAAESAKIYEYKI